MGMPDQDAPRVVRVTSLLTFVVRACTPAFLRSDMLRQWRHRTFALGLLIVLAAGMLSSQPVSASPALPALPASPLVSRSLSQHYQPVGVKQFYVALGDSLAYGFQPDLNIFYGYAAQWYTDLQKHGSKAYINYSCMGETTATFIYGGCPFALGNHVFHPQPQLDVALAFIKAHPGQVSPISLDIGADDMLPDIDPGSCAISARWNSDVQGVENRLTTVILPQLTRALTNSHGVRTGDLVMMNYYDPYQLQCPNAHPYMVDFNSRLARAAAKFNVPVVDVSQVFGPPTSENICRYTYMCSIVHDRHILGNGIHATTEGYLAIARAFERRMGY